MSDRQGDQAAEHARFTTYPADGYARWITALTHRWPTALGLALAVLTFADQEVSVEFVSTIAGIILLMALIYFGAAVLERRWTAWILFLIGFAVVTAARLLGLPTSPAIVFLAGALIFLVLSVIGGQWRASGSLPLQAIGMLGFGAAGLLALYVTPILAGYLTATTLIGHAAWDAVHLWRNRVVTRSYAEFCAAVDLVLGIAIFVLA
ncbi:hypothetical protein [Kallotenue papyrolyticum]|uniref:hypothetical protein n=1 Tax=Kallotenue papyrolyticum TaxID=1325125 RepID=UPI0004707E44|nr:hypothetical protein [Kallotenue papyrolyticum]